VARINVVAHGLAHEVGGDRVALKPGGLDLGALVIAVGLVGLGDFEVVAPAGELHSIIAEALGFLQHGIQRQICPLAGKQGDWTAHNDCNDR